MPQGLCPPPPSHEESRGLYKGMAHSQVSVMRNKWVGSRSLPRAIFQKQSWTEVNNPVTDSGSWGGSAALFLICKYKGKGVVRVTTR